MIDCWGVVLEEKRELVNYDSCFWFSYRNSGLCMRGLELGWVGVMVLGCRNLRWGVMENRVLKGWESVLLSLRMEGM